MNIRQRVSVVIMAKNFLFVAQSGGPTSVINSTLAGIIAAAQKRREIDGIYGLVHGLEGALRGEVIELNLTNSELERLNNTPAAILGGSRHPLEETDLEKIIDFFSQNNCRYFLFIGGNGTMETCLRLREAASRQKVSMEIIGVPKTVDNDLAETDHAPGYASAARYVALSVRDQLLDLESMRRFEQVRIIETMGRRVGWLAAASFLAVDATNTVHPLFIPEVPIDEEEFLAHIEKVYKEQGFVLVAIGEGVGNNKGEPLGHTPFAGLNDKGCHTVRTGAAEYLVRRVSEKLKLRARAQVLGMNQRSFTACVSPIDREEAYRVGVAAVNMAVEGRGGHMVTLIREGTSSRVGFVPLERVAGIERKFPLKFYDQARKRVTKEFVDWISPLVGDLGPTYLYRNELFTTIKARGGKLALEEVACSGGRGYCGWS